MKTLSEIKAEVDRLAALISAPETLLPVYGRTSCEMQPCVDADSCSYHYVITERGEVIQHITTNDLDDLLFHIFAGITFTMAVNYELAHRVAGQDTRRLMFMHQEQLLALLSPRWKEREAHNHQQILQHHPYDDKALLRVDLTVAYRDKGYSPEDAWKLACEQYPQPVL